MTEAGQLYSWGENNFGQLGHGDNFDRSAPKSLETLPVLDFRGLQEPDGEEAHGDPASPGSQGPPNEDQGESTPPDAKAEASRRCVWDAKAALDSSLSRLGSPVSSSSHDDLTEELTAAQLKVLVMQARSDAERKGREMRQLEG